MLKFIDIHAHAYRRPVPFVVQFCSADELKARYQAEGVQMGALLPIVSPEIYLPQANEDILEMVEQSPECFFPFCNVDPRALTNRADAPLDSVLAYYRDLGCRGVGEIMPNLRMDDPRVQNLFRCAEKVGLRGVFRQNVLFDCNQSSLLHGPSLQRICIVSEEPHPATAN